MKDLGWVSGEALVKLVSAGSLTVTAALVPAAFFTVRECHLSPCMSKASEFVSVLKLSLLIYGKNPFCLQIWQLVWPWAVGAWQRQRQGDLWYFRTLVLAAAALSSDWSLVLQRDAKTSLTLQGTRQSPHMRGTNIIMQICRFKTPRSCSASPVAREGEGLQNNSRLEGSIISTELDLSWALAKGFIPGAAMNHFMVYYPRSRKQCLILKLSIQLKFSSVWSLRGYVGKVWSLTAFF